MDSGSPSQNKPKSKGLPLWTALVALLVLAVVAIGALGAMLYYANSDKIRLEKEREAAAAQQVRIELATEKAAADAQLALARTRQEEVLAFARSATNALGTLMTQATALSSQTAALKTNEVGLAIARHPDLVVQARRLYDVNLPKLAPMAEIITRLEGVRRIEQKLVSAAGTTYEPEAAFKVTALNSTLWAEQELRTVREAQTLLSALIRDSEIKVVTIPLSDAPPSLATAIDALTQAESAERQRALLEKTTAAEQDAANTLAEAEAAAIRERAEKEAAAAKALAVAEAEQIRQEAEREAARLLREAQAQTDEQERQARIEEAEGQLADSKAEVAALQTENEAARTLLRQKASSPAVQARLAPFITPGYKLAIVGISPDLSPHSLSQLQSTGALQPTLAGMRKLASIAHSPRDKVRPRWNTGQSWPKDPQKMEMVKEAQSLLIELGPVLVEMGQLLP